MFSCKIVLENSRITKTWTLHDYERLIKSDREREAIELQVQFLREVLSKGLISGNLATYGQVDISPHLHIWHHGHNGNNYNRLKQM
jgi:hypothetical protein